MLSSNGMLRKSIRHGQKKKKKKVRGKGNKRYLLAGGGFLDAADSALQKKDSSAKKIYMEVSLNLSGV